MLFTLLAFVVALGTLITFHELGHYWVARLCGVRVLRFSIGFGKVLARRIDRHGTEWAISSIPLGGYVKMQDDAPAGASETEAARSFNRQPVSRRFAIVAAGPVFNLILAVLLYSALNLTGSEQPAAILAQPPVGSAAYKAGFDGGDTIQAIDGGTVRSWADVRWRMVDALATGGSVDIDVLTRQGVSRQHRLEVVRHDMDPTRGDPLREAGFLIAMPQPAVQGVIKGGIADAAGMRTGDLIVAAASVQHPDPSALIQIIQQHADQPLTLGVQRQGDTFTLELIPRGEVVDGKKIGRIGIEVGAKWAMTTVRYGFIESVQRAATQTWDTAWFSLRMMGRMISGQVSWRNVSGPVTIADYAGQTARMGLSDYIAYLALISISLGVLNLLPIPMLDGGHLLYYLVEIVRGRPPSERWMEIGQRVGLGLLVALMGLALFNDFLRLFT